MSSDAVAALRHQRIGLILRYTLLMLVASIATGFIMGMFRALFLDTEVEHRWGVWDSVLVTRFIGTLVVCFAVYWRLTKRHPQGYLANGAAIAALTGVLSFICSLAYAPQVRLSALVLSVTLHVAIFLIAAVTLRVAMRLPAINLQQAQQSVQPDRREDAAPG